MSKNIENLLKKLGDRMGLDAKSQLLGKLVIMNGKLNESPDSDEIERLLEYGRKPIREEAYKVLGDLFTFGNCPEYLNIFNPEAYFVDRCDAILDLPFYLLDDVDVSLVMCEYDYFFKVNSMKEVRHKNTFMGIFKDTWYSNEEVLEKGYWLGRLKIGIPVDIDENTMEISHVCLQNGKFHQLMDIIYDERNIINVEDSVVEFTDDGPKTVKKRIDKFNQQAIVDFIRSEKTIEK